MTYVDYQIEEVQEELEQLRKRQYNAESDKEWDDLEDKIAELEEELRMLENQAEFLTPDTYDVDAAVDEMRWGEY